MFHFSSLPFFRTLYLVRVISELSELYDTVDVDQLVSLSLSILQRLLLGGVDLGHLGLDDLVELRIRLPLHVGAEQALLPPRHVLLVPPMPHAAHAVPPVQTHVLDALEQVVALLGLDLEGQLELVVGVALGLLVEVGRGLDGAQDGLDVGLLVGDDGYGAPALRDHLRHLPQRVRQPGLLAVRLHAQVAHHVRVEAPAALELLQRLPEVLVVRPHARRHVREVQRLLGVRRRVLGPVVGVAAVGVAVAAAGRRDGFRQLRADLLLLALDVVPPGLPQFAFTLVRSRGRVEGSGCARGSNNRLEKTWRGAVIAVYYESRSNYVVAICCVRISQWS